jgi:hypothetical protein
MEAQLMSNVKISFKKMAMIAQKKWENTYGSEEIEPKLLDILNYVKANLNKRNILSQCFIDIINDYRNGPLEIVIFSMRELKWDEVKNAALNRKKISDDPRVWSAMDDVLAVYKDKWEDAELYKYYS